MIGPSPALESPATFHPAKICLGSYSDIAQPPYTPRRATHDGTMTLECTLVGLVAAVPCYLSRWASLRDSEERQRRAVQITHTDTYDTGRLHRTMWPQLLFPLSFFLVCFFFLLSRFSSCQALKDLRVPAD